MEQRLVDFYSRLLAWLPRGFRDEFGEEMVQVFASRVQEAGLCGGRALCRTLVGELLALLGLWLLAVQRERSILTVNNPDASAAPDGPATGGPAARAPASWGATLAGRSMHVFVQNTPPSLFSVSSLSAAGTPNMKQSCRITSVLT